MNNVPSLPDLIRRRRFVVFSVAYWKEKGEADKARMYADELTLIDKEMEGKMSWFRKNIHFAESMLPLVKAIPDGHFSALVAVFIRTLPKINPDEKDRDLARRELDLMVEKITQ